MVQAGLAQEVFKTPNFIWKDYDYYQLDHSQKHLSCGHASAENVWRHLSEGR